MNVLTIASRIHDYKVIEHEGVNAALRTVVSEGSPFVLLDRKVGNLFSDPIFSTLDKDRTLLIDANETSKSYEHLEPVFRWLLERKCRRNSHLVVIGGGVLQDIGCFIASVLLRGIRWTLLPTTLLAQCDSCIGSKSSLNIGSFKNQIGTFYPPHEIELVFDFLATLQEADIYSGLGEAVKLHLIDGQESIERLRSLLGGGKPDTGVIRNIVRDSLLIKKRFIEADEFDRGVRNILNYGHTFAHGFESATAYAVPHGVAVSLGLACATLFSEKLGFVAAGTFADLHGWLKPYFGTSVEAVRRADVESIIGAMRQDKKNLGDDVQFILTDGPGQMKKHALSISETRVLLNKCLQLL